MKHEIRHRSYRPTLGGASVPSDHVINDLGESAIYYIGSFSEFNPIGIVDSGDHTIAAYVRKETTSSINQQKPFELPGFVLKSGLHYHGTDFNNSCAIQFSKQDLLRIAHAMDETDTLQIAVPDSWDYFGFKAQVNKVTG